MILEDAGINLEVCCLLLSEVKQINKDYENFQISAEERAYSIRAIDRILLKLGYKMTNEEQWLV